MKITGIILGAIIGLIALIFLVNEFEIFGMKFWGTRRENARREIYEKSQSYVQGKKQELIKCHSEWCKAKTPEDQKIIEAQVRHQFAEFNEDKDGNDMPSELMSFLKKCKYQ